MIQSTTKKDLIKSRIYLTEYVRKKLFPEVSKKVNNSLYSSAQGSDRINRVEQPAILCRLTVAYFVAASLLGVSFDEFSLINLT